MEKPMDKKNSKPDLLSRDYLAGALSYVCEMVKQTAKDFHHFGPNDNKDNLERIAALGGQRAVPGRLQEDRAAAPRLVRAVRAVGRRGAPSQEENV